MAGEVFIAKEETSQEIKTAVEGISNKTDTIITDIHNIVNGEEVQY